MNSVLRLANTLDRLKAFQKGNVADSWSTLLQIDHPSEDFFFAMTLVFANHANATALIANSALSDRAKGLYITAARKVGAFCNPIGLTQIQAKQVSHENPSIDMLFLAAESLPSDESTINPITIESMIDQVETLLGDLKIIDIDSALKLELVSLLNTFLLALRAYEIFGASGLSKIYGAVASEIARVGNRPEAKNAKSLGWFGKARSTLKTIGAAVIWTGAVVGGAHELITDGSELLGLGNESDASDSSTR